MSLFEKNLFSVSLHIGYENILLESIPEIKTCIHNNYSLVQYDITSPQKYYHQEIENIFYKFFINTINTSKKLEVSFPNKNIFLSFLINI